MSEIEVYEQAEDAEVVPTQVGGVLSVRDPEQMLEQAANLANRLKDVVTKAGLVSTISGKEYLTVDAWTTLGVLVGCTARTEWTRPIEGGWEAAVEVVNAHGLVVGRAEASCLRAERNWKNRDDYAIRSMAQTRAMGKALRMPLGWIASLAGYQATPAEEMPREPAAEVRIDGHEPAKQATSWADWEKRMTALEIPRPMDWLKAAAEAEGLDGAKDKAWGRALSQKANRTLLWFADSEPASSLGFWDQIELQAGWAHGFDGLVVTLPPVEPEVLNCPDCGQPLELGHDCLA